MRSFDTELPHFVDEVGQVVITTADGSGEIPVPDVDARDTLGAGDVWHGAFAYAVARGEGDVPDWIGFANEVAAERVRHEGPRSWTAAVGRMGVR